MNWPFRFLLVSQTISQVGSQITLVALPLTAVLLLHATPFQMGLLTGAGTLPGTLFGLLAGVVADRVPKRRILIGADIASTAVLSLMPLAAIAHFLSLDLEIIVAFVATTIASIRNKTLISALPSLVSKEQLKAANGRYAAGLAAAAVLGPALAGGLIAVSSAPRAILVDAASFLMSAILAVGLPALPPSAAGKQNLLTDLASGFSVFTGDPITQRVVLAGTGLNFLGGVSAALLALFVVQRLGIKPQWYGAGLAVGGGGTFFGAMLTRRLSERFGLIKLLASVVAVFALAYGIISTLTGPPLICALIFGGIMFALGVGGAIVNVGFSTYLQETAAPGTIGRVLGAVGTIIGASRPVGSVIGGAIGASIGVRHAIMAMAVGYVLLAAFTAMSPERSRAEKS